MRRPKVAAMALAIGAMIALYADVASAQDARRGGARAERGERRGRGRWDPARMRQRRLERMKDVLQAGDAEWKALAPRIEQVMTLSDELRGRDAMRLVYSRRRRSGGGGEPEAPKSAVGKAMVDLHKTMENAKATPEAIKTKLTALREAREQAKAKLAKAQAELRQLLTQRQEAQLVLMGTLD